MSFDKFIGPATVSEAFVVQGRGSDYDHVFDWEPDEPALWASTDGDYLVHSLSEFDPDTVVLRHGGETVGLYMGGELWIDEPHRGKGLAPEMILACIEWIGKVPFDNRGGIGFSRAGYAAHERAHAVAVERAAGRTPMPEPPEAPSSSPSP